MHLRIFVVLVAGFALNNTLTFATTFVNRSLGDVVAESPIIVRGRTGDSHADWDKSGNRRLYTYTSFTVTEVLKGTLKEAKILLRQPGGSKDGMEMNVPGAASFKPDEDVVVLLSAKNADDSSYDVPGFATGKYKVSSTDGGEPVLVNSMGGGAMYDPSKDARTLSYSSSIPLEVFRRIARGEDLPEAAHKQFDQSKKPAPPGTYDAGHSHADHGDEHGAVQGAAKSVAPASVDAEAGQKSSLPWIIVGIVIAIAILGIAWMVLK